MRVRAHRAIAGQHVLADVLPALRRRAVLYLREGFEQRLKVGGEWRTLRVRVPVGDIEDGADDLLQEAITRWLETFDLDHSARELYVWLDQAMRYVLWNRFRRQYPEPLDADPLSLDEPWARLGS